jgi:hypothetical protein
VFSDTDGDSLTYLIGSQPSRELSSSTPSTGAYTYVPFPGKVGADPSVQGERRHRQSNAAKVDIKIQ